MGFRGRNAHSNRGEKPAARPACGRLASLSMSPPRAPIFHEISRAAGPFKQGRQTNPGSRSRKPETDGTASEFPAKGAGNPWQSRQSPEGTVVGGQFFMKFRGPKAHPNRPGGLSYGLWPFSSGEFVPVAAPGSVGGRRLPLAVRRGESGSPSQGVALSPTLLAKMCFPAW